MMTNAKPAKISTPSIVSRFPEMIHKLWSADDGRQEYVKYASSIGGLEFVALLEAENGLWTIDRQSNTSYYKIGQTVHGIWVPSGTYWDYGFCQISNYYHPEVTSDKRFYTDWKWQIGECLKLYEGGTKFYGMNNVWKTKKRFIRK